MLRRGILPLFILITSPLWSFNIDSAKVTAPRYIEDHKDLALREMKYNGIPASITLAQGMVETACGCSELARNANNHFGIKCHETWNGETYTYTDDAANECFRKYNSAKESYIDHSKFLRTRARYAFLFNLRITDYKGWANGLKKAGYATNPKYPQMLIAVIEKYQLYQYDYVIEIPEEEVVKPNTSLLTIIDCTPGEIENRNMNGNVEDSGMSDCEQTTMPVLFIPSSFGIPSSAEHSAFEDEFHHSPIEN